MVTASPAVLTVSRKVFRGHGAQIPLAATVLPSEVACAIELRVSSLPRTSAIPYQDCRAPRSRRPGVATAAGITAAARPSASWIWPRQTAQYRSYFDATSPVCPHQPCTARSQPELTTRRPSTTSLWVTGHHKLDAKRHRSGVHRLRLPFLYGTPEWAICAWRCPDEGGWPSRIGAPAGW